MPRPTLTAALPVSGEDLRRIIEEAEADFDPTAQYEILVLSDSSERLAIKNDPILVAEKESGKWIGLPAPPDGV